MLKERLNTIVLYTLVTFVKTLNLLLQVKDVFVGLDSWKDDGASSALVEINNRELKQQQIAKSLEVIDLFPETVSVTDLQCRDWTFQKGSQNVLAWKGPQRPSSSRPPAVGGVATH